MNMATVQPLESGDELVKKGRKKFRTKCIVACLVAVILIAVAAGLIAFFLSGGDEVLESEPEVPSEADLVKLDCFPEARSPQEQLTREKCESRGCIYEPSDVAGVPDCFVDVESAGFDFPG